MKKFIISLIVFCGIIILISEIVSMLLLPAILTDNTYTAASIDKQKMLREIPAPRIILTGGSNVAFGLNSEIIKAVTGYPVINAGLHAGFGLKYILNETAAGVKEGDIVVLIPEYYLSDGDQRLLAMLESVNHPAIQYMRFTPFEYLRFKTFQVQIFFKFLFYGGESLDGIYVRNGFSKQGDLLTHINKTSIFNKLNVKLPHAKSDYAEELILINNFINEIKSKKARVFFTYPGIAESVYKADTNLFADYKYLIEKSVYCKILGSPELSIYPDADFYDTRYHLNGESRNQSSAYLARLINIELHHL